MRQAASFVVVVAALISVPVCATAAEGTADGVVRAVLFSSPTCPHCQQVREKCLPALFERFGGRLQIAVLSTATPSGLSLYGSALQRYGIPRRGVPLLVIGDTTLVGSLEIPERLPGLIQQHLERGGLDWPDIPDLAAAVAPEVPASDPSLDTSPATSTGIATAPPAAASEPAAPTTEAASAARPSSTARPFAESTAGGRDVSVAARRASSAAVVQGAATGRTPAAAGFGAAPFAAGKPPSLGAADRFRADPLGNGLAVLVLVAMVGVLLRTGARLVRGSRDGLVSRWDGLSPVLATLGLGVAGYLATVELRAVEAVCGPVGDCNTVQQSEYARLFGVVPIGVLGVLGFSIILLVWAVKQWGSPRASSWAAAALLLATGAGTLFSAYLTFLEPFVIGASCLWCLSSAVLMTALHVLALPAGHAAALRTAGLFASGRHASGAPSRHDDHELR